MDRDELRRSVANDEAQRSAAELEKALSPDDNYVEVLANAHNALNLIADFFGQQLKQGNVDMSGMPYFPTEDVFSTPRARRALEKTVNDLVDIKGDTYQLDGGKRKRLKAALLAVLPKVSKE